jgi:transposase-like protein
MYPVAYGLAQETTDNWTWFMEQFKSDHPLLVVCSDACKGLENAVKTVFPNAEQRECFYHMVRNFKKIYRGFGQVYPAARAYTEEIFYDNIEKMISESAAAVQWLQANHKLLWYWCGFNL